MLEVRMSQSRVKIIEAMRVACIRYGYHDTYWSLTHEHELTPRRLAILRRMRKKGKMKDKPVHKRPPKRKFRSKKR